MPRPGLAAAGFAILTIGLTAFNVRAQVSPPPAPSAPGPQRANTQATGTGIIHGRVIDGDTGRPLRGAVVRAMVAGGVVVFDGRRDNRSATTDEQGRYALVDLPAGGYTLMVSKGNYVSLSYGQARPTDAAKSIDILDGQTVDKVDFSLPRGGVITGHVVDEYGDPVPNVQVSALRSQFVQGHRRLMPGGRTPATDDLGEYRLFGLNPADYYVSATYRPPPASAADDDVPGYAVTYSPGTVSAADARRVTIGSARSVDEVDIALVPVKIARISGTAVDSKGQPMGGGFVSVVERNNPFGSGNGAPLRPDGTFVIRNLPPGEYVVRAQNMSARGERPEIAATTISVTGQDIEGVQLVVMPPSTVSGVVVVDPAAAAAIKASSIVLMVSPVDLQMNFTDRSGQPKDDFTFEASVQPGMNIVRLLSMPSSLALKAVRVGGVDVTDSGFDVKPNENLSGVEIELTSHPTVVSGQVTDSRGAAVKNSTVIVFARDERKWESAARYVRTTKTDQDGKFRMTGLPPGDYHVVAADSSRPPEQASDPDVLKGIRDRASAVSLGEGETKVVDLKVITGS